MAKMGLEPKALFSLRSPQTRLNAKRSTCRSPFSAEESHIAVGQVIVKPEIGRRNELPGNRNHVELLGDHFDAGRH